MILKEQTGTFYLPQQTWENIKFLSQYFGISKSCVIERVLYAKEKGYEKAAHYTSKSKKKVSPKANKSSKAKKICAPKLEESLFDYRARAVYEMAF